MENGAFRNGWGWTPCSREGWLVSTVIFLALIGGDIAIPVIAADPSEITWRLGFLPHLPARPGVIAPVVAWNALVLVPAIWICWKTGERPRWRWRK